jgi:hypothetical protein
MIALKQLIKYDNANCLEATWVDIQPLPDIEHPEVPEQPALYDGDGNEVQAAVPAVPAWTESSRTQEVAIHCQAYSDEQIDLLREHAANYGTPLDDYEDLIQEVIEAHVPPPPPTQEEIDRVIASKIEQLWSAADKYVNGYISGVAVGLLTIGVIQQKPKSLAITAWSQSVWNEYYIRKAAVTFDSVLDLDFSSFGPMPFTVPELQAEVFGT